MRRSAVEKKEEGETDEGEEEVEEEEEAIPSDVETKVPRDDAGACGAAKSKSGSGIGIVAQGVVS
ncbi:uncharacterized protein LOC105662725 isoform X2 [Megachile rotundata]|uniref:uncharacterized protein LOC105662725 isoform X2 n=1 Tax=Megachile rotundata TaxID=143995 RepID=UPI003FD1BC01